MSKPHLLIVGAGIGGTVAALALVQRGFSVSVYEQATELRELGAGLQVTPNGSRVLCALGLGTAIEAIATVPTSRTIRLFSTGQTWPLQSAVAFDFPFWPLHRGDLHKTLVTALEQCLPGAIHTASRCAGFVQDEDGVTLRLEDGRQVRGDALIGADGVHSLFGTSCSGSRGPPSRALWLGVHLSQQSGCQLGFANNTLRRGLVRTATLSLIRSAKASC